jgi:hypothetical protein
MTSSLAVTIATLTSALSTCMPLPVPEAVSRAAVILHGIVENVDSLDPSAVDTNRDRQYLCGPKLVTFRVIKLLKGDAGETISAFSEDGCIGLGGYYRPGEEFVAFALPRTDEAVKWILSRRDNAQAVPASNQLFLHTCYGTRRIGPPIGHAAPEDPAP